MNDPLANYRRIIKYKPSFRTCEFCSKQYDMHKAKNIFIHPSCSAWPVYKNGLLVQLNMYDTEMEMEKEIAWAWELKVRSITAWESEWSECKIRCWYCNEWFISDSDIPASCYKCATIKEETP